MLERRPHGHLDRDAQERALSLLERADLILLVLDRSQPADQLRSLPLGRLPPERTLVILNKSDLSARLSREPMGRFERIHEISAREETGFPGLLDGIRILCGVPDLEVKAPTPFTRRQRDLLRAASAWTTARDSSSTWPFGGER